MKKTLFEELQQSLKEAITIHHKGIASGIVATTHIPKAQDIKNKVGLSQRGLSQPIDVSQQLKKCPPNI
jgi:hypothetical protein